MTEERQFRFLIPPFFFGLSILVGAWYSCLDFGGVVKGYSTEQLVALGAAIGAASLPIGFFLTSVSILLLRLIALSFGGRTYEVVVPNAWPSRVWPTLGLPEPADEKLTLGLPKPADKKWLLYAAATFDHELIPAETHAWIQRRWSAFHLAAHSCTAVLLGHVAAGLAAVHLTWEWVGVSAVLVVVLAISAYIAWSQIMRMLEFQSHRMPSVFARPPTAG